jgi:hypothetical protein
VVAAGVGRGGREASETRDQGEGEGSDADSMHGGFLLRQVMESASGGFLSTRGTSQHANALESQKEQLSQISLK